ncbi:hypothetical protein ACQ4M4_25420 [Leptolyngbya sp. AN02str]|uniref:hypothetical protein n=1 Tax=Leptolyngbya sp. AN02str TaxID=3423363 RepID=UPI003D30F169
MLLILYRLPAAASAALAAANSDRAIAVHPYVLRGHACVNLQKRLALHETNPAAEVRT